MMNAGYALLLSRDDFARSSTASEDWQAGGQPRAGQGDGTTRVPQGLPAWAAHGVAWLLRAGIVLLHRR